MSESNIEQPREKGPLPKPVPAYLPTTGSPLTVDKELYAKIRSAPRVLVEEFRLEIRSGRAWTAPAGSIIQISTPEGPQVGVYLLPNKPPSTPYLIRIVRRIGVVGRINVMTVTVTIFFLPATCPPHLRTSTSVFCAVCCSSASMSRYWAGDDAWTNLSLEALPRGREGSADYGSGAFDVTSQSSYMTASDTFDGFLGSASPTAFAPSFEPSHAVQADIPTSVRTVPPTELHTLLHQTLNSTPVLIDDEWQQILNQLGPNGLAESGTVGDISNADQFDFSSIPPFPSRPPSSASDYNMFETGTGNPDASLGHYYSGPPSSGSWQAQRGDLAGKTDIN
ncbi:hypothetical protein DFH09DRAFT_1280954 [Mycena vulgaris]|nr:hypothetical protein DFH09DRAFT_1280954 [Mycena vulgaris]